MVRRPTTDDNDVMTDTPGPETDEPSGPSTPSDPGMAGPAGRRLRRTSPGQVGGVAAGLADYLGISPVVIRIGFAVLALISGFGIFVYVGAWLLVPADDDDPRSLVLTSDVTALVAGFAALALGSLVASTGFAIDFTLWLAALAVGAGFWVLNQRRDPETSTIPFASQPPPPGPSSVPPPFPGPMGPPTGTGPAAWPASPTAPGPETPDHPADPRRSAPGPGSATSPSSARSSVPGWTAGQAVPPPYPAATAGGTEPTPPGSPGGPGGVAGFRPGPPGAGPAGPPPWPPRTGWAHIQAEADEPTPEPGPPLVSLSVAAAVVVIGALLVTRNLGGADISASLTLGAVLAVFGLGLIVSAFTRRSLALWLLSLATTMLLIVSPLLDGALRGGVGTREIDVDGAGAALESSYDLGAGELTLDLRLLELDTDRTVEVNVGAGYAEILIPDDLPVRIEAASTFGYVEILGIPEEGVLNDLLVVDEPPGSTQQGTLTLRPRVAFGYVEVRRG